MLIQFSNKNKHGNLRTRVFHSKSKRGFGVRPGGFGDFIAVKQFRYQYTHKTLPPSIFKSTDGKFYIIPTWQEVLPETTFNDIEWVREKAKVEKKISKPKEWKFESKSKPGNFYIVKQISDYKVTCNCSGQYRAKDRKCIHLKTVIKELGI